VRAGGAQNIWCAGKVGIERCRRFCSELDDFYYSPDIIIIIVARNIIYMCVACSMHIVKKKGTQSLLRKPEQ
jgi:hypothetical protein